MKKVCKKAGIWGILLGIMLFAVGFTLQATTVETQAAAITGFRTINGKTYYYKNGKKVKGWLTLGNNKYFLNTKTGVLYKGWQKSSKGPKRYFDSKTGVMSKGLKKVGGNYYYRIYGQWVCQIFEDSCEIFFARYLYNGNRLDEEQQRAEVVFQTVRWRDVQRT